MELLKGLLSRPGHPELLHFSLVSSGHDGCTYLIKVRDSDGSTFEAQRQSRDFYWLAECARDANLRIRHLPRKEWFGVTHFAAGPVRVLFTAHRRRCFEAFLRSILVQVDATSELGALVIFFGPLASLDHGVSSFLYQDACSVIRGAAKHELHHNDSVNYVATSRDLSLIVSASEDSTVRVWKVGATQRWECVQTLLGHTAGVNGVAISEDLSLIGTVGEDTTCRIWQLAEVEGGVREWRCSFVCEGHTAPLRFLAISQDLLFIVTVSDDQTARVWGRVEGEDWECTAVLAGHEDAVYGVSIARDEACIATAGDDCTCRIWGRSGEGWSCQQILEGHSAGIYSCNFSDCGSLLATTSADDTVRLWSGGSGQGGWELTQVLLGHCSPVYDAAIASDLSLIATGDEAGSCFLWSREGEEWKQTQVLNGHRKTVYGVNISPGKRPGEQSIGTGSEDKTSIIWRYDGTRAYKATHIRPASDFEVSWPVVALAVNVLQSASMAFHAQSFTRYPAVSVVRDTLSITVLALSFSLPPMLQFVVKTAAALLLALAFMCCAFFGKGKLLVYGLSTVMVLPITRQLFTVFDCDEGYLEAIPTIACYEGAHLYLSLVAALVTLPFLLIILGPYTAADGDMQVMPRYVWLQPREWMRRKRDKIIGLDLGLVSPTPVGGVLYAYVNMYQRISLLAITIFLNHHEVESSVLSLAVSCTALLLSLACPPMQFKVTNVVLLKGQALCVNAFFASMISAVIDDPGSSLPSAALFLGWAAIVLHTFFMLWRSQHRGHQKLGSMFEQGFKSF